MKKNKFLIHILTIIIIYSSLLFSAELELLMADPEVRIAQKIYCRISQVEPTDQLIAFLDDKVIYQKESNLDTLETFIANYRHQKAGKHKLLVKIVDRNKQEKVSVCKEWITLHNGIPQVGIDENNSIRVNGKLFFPVYAPVGTHAPYWLQNGYMNTGSDMNYLHPNFTDYTIEEYSRWLDSCVKWGIRNIGPTHRWSGHYSPPHGRDNDTVKMKEYILACRSHPGVLMWQWADEPDGGGRGVAAEPNIIRAWTELCHRYDTDHPHAVNLVAYGWGSDHSYYIESCQNYSYLYGSKWHNNTKKLIADVIGFDYYPIEYATKTSLAYTTCTFSNMVKALNRIREWNYDLCPIFSWIENCDIHPDEDKDGYADGPGTAYRWTPAPTPAQVWSEYWLKVIHGVKGFKVHAAFDTNCTCIKKSGVCIGPPCNGETMAKFLKWMNELKEIILGPPVSIEISNNAQQYGKRVDYMVRADSNRVIYIISARLTEVAEDSASPILVEFSIKNVDSSKVEVYGENRSLKMKNGKFQDSFAPWDVHIYKLNQVKASIIDNNMLKPHNKNKNRNKNYHRTSLRNIHGKSIILYNSLGKKISTSHKYPKYLNNGIYFIQYDDKNDIEKIVFFQ